MVEEALSHGRLHRGDGAPGIEREVHALWRGDGERAAVVRRALGHLRG
jgi:hypothetical protein